MKSELDSHPVERLFSRLKAFEYPNGLVRVRKRIAGTAFFPGGYGLWREPQGQLLPPIPLMPCGKVMVLGNDFGWQCEHSKSLCAGTERHTPTWQTLLRLLESVDIQPQECFFTNAYMGLRTCLPSTGPSPGAKGLAVQDALPVVPQGPDRRAETATPPDIGDIRPGVHSIPVV